MGGIGDTERTYYCDHCGYHGILNDGGKVIELTDKGSGGGTVYTILCPKCAKKLFENCFVSASEKPFSDAYLGGGILNTPSYNDGKYGVADAQI